MKLKPLERSVKVVLDTNVVVSSAIAKDGNPAKIFELLLFEAINNYTIEEIINKVVNVLNRPRITHLLSLVDKEFIINRFKEFSKIIKPVIKLKVVKEDPSEGAIYL